jgi:hypothetical protein
VWVGTCVRAGLRLRLGRTDRDRCTCTHLSRTTQTNNTPTYLPTCLPTYTASSRIHSGVVPPCPSMPPARATTGATTGATPVFPPPTTSSTYPSHRRIQPPWKLCKTHLHRRSHATEPHSAALLPTLVPFRSPLPSPPLYTDTPQKRVAGAGRRSEKETQRERDGEHRTAPERSGKRTHPHTHAARSLRSLHAAGLGVTPVPRACR